jgi:hypothetical protein
MISEQWSIEDHEFCWTLNYNLSVTNFRYSIPIAGYVHWMKE